MIDAEGGAPASPDAYYNVHTFVYEKGPPPPHGYRTIRAASVSVPLAHLDATQSEAQVEQERRELLSLAVAALRAAGAAGSDIAVLPESFAGLTPIIVRLQGEGGRGEAREGREGKGKDLDSIGELSQVAAAYNMYIVCPIKEIVFAEGDVNGADVSRGRVSGVAAGRHMVYNTAVLLGRDGTPIGRYRKRFPFWGFPEDAPPAGLATQREATSAEGKYGGLRERESERVPDPPPVFDLDFGYADVC